MSRELFLTSSPFEAKRESLNPQNKFADRLRESCARCRHALFITSDPDHVEFTEGFANGVFQVMKQTGMSFQSYNILDGRNMNMAKELLRNSDFIILAGGHVPTQNTFFQKIALRELMESFDGTVLGISAGTMNSADVVYAQPEEEGEGSNPDFVKFLPGLNLTKYMIIPHYQDTKDNILDGKKLFEDITYPDSMGKTFYALPDGSYLYARGEKEVLCGEAYQIRDGICEKICSENEEYCLVS